VAQALSTCTERWLRPILRLATARVVVLLGRRAQQPFLALYPGLAPVALSGPQQVEGRPRIILQVPHSNAHVKRANLFPLTPDQRGAVRAHLRGV